MLRKLMVFAVTSGLAAKALQHWRAQRQQRAARRGGIERDAVQRWDDEGGASAVPRTGPDRAPLSFTNHSAAGAARLAAAGVLDTQKRLGVPVLVSNQSSLALRSQSLTWRSASSRAMP